MDTFEMLKSRAGNWQGMNRLHDPITEKIEDTVSTLEIMDEVDGTLRFEYTWSYQGEPQQGTLLLRTDMAGKLTADWIDGWHTGGEKMIFAAENDDFPLSLLGSYAAPPGPDWGWRILLEPGDPLQVRMFNISPDGAEDIAVEATYKRA